MKRKRIIAGLLILAVLMSSCKKKEKDTSSDKNSDISTETELDPSDTEDGSGSTSNAEFTRPDKNTVTEITQKLENSAGSPFPVSLTPRGEYDFDFAAGRIPPQTVAFEFLATDYPENNGGHHPLTWYDQELIETCLDEAFARIEKDEKLSSEITSTLRSSNTTPNVEIVRIVLIPNGGRSLYCMILSFNDDEECYKEGFFLSLDGKEPDITFTTVNAGYASSISGPFAYMHKDDNVTSLFSTLMEAYKNSPDGIPLGQEDKEGRHWSDGKTGECISPALGLPNTDPTEDSEIILISDSMLRSSFYYLGNNEWLYSDVITNRACFTVDDETNQKLLDQLRAEAALSVSTQVSYSDYCKFYEGFSVDWGSSYLVSRLSDSQKNTNCQYSSAFLDRRHVQVCIFSYSGEQLLYEQSDRERTDAGTDDNPYYLDDECYEYVTDGNEAYSRSDFTDTYYPADSFTGTYDPVPIGKTLSESGTFRCGYEVEAPSGKGSLEIYELNGATWYLLLSENGEIQSGWLSENGGLSVFTMLLNYDTEDPGKDVAEVIEFAKDHTKSQKEKEEQDAKKTDSDWQKEDALEAGFFDLGGDLIKGEEIDGSPVVENLISELLSTKKYHIEFFSYGNYKSKEIKITSDGKDYASYTKVQSHDNSSDYDMTQVVIGDAIYQFSSESTDIMVFDRTSDYTAEDPLYRLPEIFQPTSAPEFHGAYKATLDGEEYIVEEWIEKGTNYKCFCKDGKLSAILYSDMGALYFGYFTCWEEKADESLMKVPG